MDPDQLILRARLLCQLIHEADLDATDQQEHLTRYIARLQRGRCSRPALCLICARHEHQRRLDRYSPRLNCLPLYLACRRMERVLRCEPAGPDYWMIAVHPPVSIASQIGWDADRQEALRWFRDCIRDTCHRVLPRRGGKIGVLHKYDELLSHNPSYRQPHFHLLLPRLEWVEDHWEDLPEPDVGCFREELARRLSRRFGISADRLDVAVNVAPRDLDAHTLGGERVRVLHALHADPADHAHRLRIGSG